MLPSRSLSLSLFSLIFSLSKNNKRVNSEKKTIDLKCAIILVSFSLPHVVIHFFTGTADRRNIIEIIMETFKKNVYRTFFSLSFFLFSLSPLFEFFFFSALRFGNFSTFSIQFDYFFFRLFDYSMCLRYFCAFLLPFWSRKKKELEI